MASTRERAGLEGGVGTVNQLRHLGPGRLPDRIEESHIRCVGRATQHRVQRIHLMTRGIHTPCRTQAFAQLRSFGTNDPTLFDTYREEDR
jgi:hypothetical protein